MVFFLLLINGSSTEQEEMKGTGTLEWFLKVSYWRCESLSCYKGLYGSDGKQIRCGKPLLVYLSLH